MQAVDTAEPRVLVCIDGSGQIEHERIFYAIGKGDIWLLPAEAGICAFQQSGEVTLLEIAIPGFQGIGDSAELE
jgi:mannose-6-phosphate isomerase